MPTQHRGAVSLLTKLDRVEQRSRSDRKAKFNNLGHLIDLEMLRGCHHALDGKKAVGTDGKTKDQRHKDREQRTHDCTAKASQFRFTGIAVAEKAPRHVPLDRNVTRLAMSDGGTHSPMARPAVTAASPPAAAAASTDSRVLTTPGVTI